MVNTTTGSLPSLTESKAPLKKKLKSEVSHLECDLHQKFTISRVVIVVISNHPTANAVDNYDILQEHYIQVQCGAYTHSY